jgi:hypothetical protein
MKRKSHRIVLFSSLLFVGACASGGTATTSQVKSESNLASAVEEMSRWSCTPSSTAAAPSDGLLADFTRNKDGAGSGSAGVPSKVFTAVPRDAAPGARMTQTEEGGKLTIEFNAAPHAKTQYLTAVMLFDRCVDGKGFTGIEFSMAGSLSGCSLTFAAIDPGHQYYEVGGPYPPQYRISPEDVTSSPRTITAPFSAPDIKGNPATPADASKLAALQWMAIVPVAPDDGSAVPPCTGKLSIDDVKLYR